MNASRDMCINGICKVRPTPRWAGGRQQHPRAPGAEEGLVVGALPAVPTQMFPDLFCYRFSVQKRG